VKVTAVTPPDAASDPAHPDHDRWVKDVTLRREVEYAQLVGLPLSYAESENSRLLERAERISTDAKPKPTAAPSVARAQRHAARGITRRAPNKQSVRRECACGTCAPCKRKIRMLAIFARQRGGDATMRPLIYDMMSASVSATAGIGPFKGLARDAVKRLLAHKLDAICDRTVVAMGAWR
jgi:hypothetical protein